MELKPGMRVHAADSTAELVVVKAPGGDVDLRCGDAAMLPGVGTGTAAAGGADGEEEQVVVGKRYANADASLLLLATKGGKGHLVADGVALEIQDPRALPSSD